MAKIIDGKAVSAAVRAGAKQEVEALKAQGIQPGLAVVIVGDDPASRVYVNNKKKACAEIGIHSEEYALPKETTQEELLDLVRRLNDKKDINGILVQLPLPKGLDEKEVIETISPLKDVDAFHPQNVGRIMIGDYHFLPCTPAGVMELLKSADVEICGRDCVVIGRSNIVGKPMAMLLLHQSGTVTICHSKTQNLKEVCRRADILVAAVGIPKFVTADMVKPGAVVIDVGMDRDENGDLILADLDALNQSLETAFDNLVWDYSIFSGSRGPVKALGWDSLFSRFGTAGVTVGLTGEAAVNMDEYAATIPFNMCHEVAHLLAIAVEDEANFAGYLACEYSDDPVFQYSGYMMAYLYCSNELYKTDREAWQEIRSQAAPELLHDLNANNQVYEENQGAVRDTAQTVYDSYLQSNGQETGVESYNMVTGLLVAWHQEKYVIREDETEPTVFDPYNYDEVFPESPAETTEPAASTEEG